MQKSKALGEYIRVLLAIVCLSFLPGAQLLAHLEKAYYLQGKLGNKTIAVKMVCYDETPALRYVYYFFENDKRDRYMPVKQIGHFWQMAPAEQPVKSNPMPEGSLTLSENSAGWQGRWTDGKGRQQAITFNPIPADFIPPPFGHLPLLQQMDPYERYRLATLHFVKTVTQKWTCGIESSEYMEPESGVSFFRLGAGSSKVNMSNVNAALEATHLSLIQKYFAYAPQKKATRPTTQLLYLTNELVSFRTVAISKLFSLTTTQIQLAATLDIATGETLKPEDFFWLDKTSSPPPASDFFTLYQYRKKVFAPTIFQWLQELYPDKMKAARCSINKVDTWNLPAWNLTATGVALGINGGDDCGTFQWAIIPYEKLKPFISRKYHLSFTK